MRLVQPIILAAIIALPLAACSTPIDAPLSPTFGQAVASMQSQIIPAEVSDLPPESSGRRGVEAIRRFERGEVRKVETQSTSTLTVNVTPSK
ncbi:hypothetical protein [Phenylobacterium sp.]|uniref:hypothetical protein n=1 Tax=Phenylobacterium sp. TaxID=1871053 RepID=UPI0028110937|nr:hypothetical protein [Phenylobacterium sp.]